MHILKSNKEHFAGLGVQSIGLFGSYARGNFNKDSDVDIFLELKNDDYKTILGILLQLEKLLQTKVDLIYNGPHIRPSFLNSVRKEIIYA